MAVRGGGGRGSRRAVRWAAENLLPEADRFVLVHVMPTITSIPTPSGTYVPIKDLDAKVVAMYVQDMRVKCEDIFTPYKKLCKSDKVETLILEDDNIPAALLGYISDSNISSLVVGSQGILCQLFKKLKGPEVPSTVLRHAIDSCDIYVISNFTVYAKRANPSTVHETSSRIFMFTQRKFRDISGVSRLHSSLMGSSVRKTFHAFSTSDISYPNRQACTQKGSWTSFRIDHEFNDTSSRDSESEKCALEHCDSMVSANTDQADIQAEIEHLRLELQNNAALLGSGVDDSEKWTDEHCDMACANAYQADSQAEIQHMQLELQNTVTMYAQACEELAQTQYKVQLCSSKWQEETRKANVVLEREEGLRKIAAQERQKYLDAMKEVDFAKELLAKEAYERQIAELTALNESAERQKIADALFSSDRRYRMYSRDEIEAATEIFSENKVIGEGGYGKVYRCNIDHTAVAVKVLCSDASDKKEEFLREVEVLSQLHHPHVVSLLGACPESGCLVYEYMENGNLEKHILQKSGGPSLPWFVRFRIAFEIACGLAFLHASKPEPIVHRDLKPGNILLDRNYMSKIGDVGLAKLMSDVIPDDVTAYGDTMLAGTLHYMDPEYQRTGTLRPKSDLYALGVIILQLVAGRHPHGLILAVENAITTGILAEVLDKAVTDWPPAETSELVGIALKCCELRCRDRPDLDTEVLPVLKRLAEKANARVKAEKDRCCTPGPFFCPILQEVMDDPHIAADGFSYEHRAIKAWLERHNVSPVTKRRLEHTMLTPNHALYSAIQEWRSQKIISVG